MLQPAMAAPPKRSTAPLVIATIILLTLLGLGGIALMFVLSRGSGSEIDNKLADAAKKYEQAVALVVLVPAQGKSVPCATAWAIGSAFSRPTPTWPNWLSK